jgi:putative FmdB family regulatory protein
MPMFDFVCTECGEKHEALVARDTEERPCPKCQQPAKKILSTGSMVFFFNYLAEE